jgi:hypothetical protein
VSFLDAILGRSKPVKANEDALFGLSTGVITLQTEAGLQPTGAGAITFRPVSSGDFAQLQQDVNALLQTSAKDSPITWTTQEDRFGYQWVILKAQEFENLVATIHMIARELQDAGYGPQLLAAVFQFKGGKSGTVYWMYNYKRGAFYPFVPSGSASRNNAEELHLSALMSRELTVEKDLSKWYPLWGIPL